ncbi:MAG: protein translocase subunit SecF [Clostridia bacterium]|nr:protein translocase subunit SecF [Clostridia bacterium]
MLKVAENKKIFFSISIAIILVGLVFYFVNGGLNLDIDYIGGTSLHLDLGETYDVADIEALVEETLPGTTPRVVKGGAEGTEVMITVKELTDEESTKLLNAIREKYDPSYNVEATEETEEVAETKFKVFTRDTVSATIGKEFGQSAVTSAIIAVLLMLVYISIRFEFWSGIAAVVSLVHNVLLVLSIYTIFNLPINSTFIASILTIVGYTINDTIVIFDRIRENNRFAKKTPFSEVVDNSVTQSLTRSINTSITTLLSIVVLYILGVNSIKTFAFPIIIGVIIGTYSSIFIASPVWSLFKKEKKNS